MSVPRRSPAELRRETVTFCIITIRILWALQQMFEQHRLLSPVKPIVGDCLMSAQMCLTWKLLFASLSFLCTFERFTSGCVRLCALYWTSLNELFFAEAVSFPSELGTWHDNWRSCNFGLKCQRYLCQNHFVWTRRHTGEGPQSLFKRHACVCSGILGGLSIVTMAIYLRLTLPHPL